MEERDGHVRVTGRCPDTKPGPKAAKSPGKVVIVGGGAAGHACAEMLARAGHARSVTVVSDDLDPPYDRTFLSKQYLVGGQVSREDCMLADPDFYDGIDGATLRRARKAIAIDADGGHVELDDGERLPFDALVIATGAEPVRLETPGLDHPDVHVLRTLHDADRIIAGAEGAKHAAVIGAIMPIAGNVGRMIGPPTAYATTGQPICPIGARAANIYRSRGARDRQGADRPLFGHAWWIAARPL